MLRTQLHEKIQLLVRPPPRGLPLALGLFLRSICRRYLRSAASTPPACLLPHACLLLHPCCHIPVSSCMPVATYLSRPAWMPHLALSAIVFIESHNAPAAATGFGVQTQAELEYDELKRTLHDVMQTSQMASASNISQVPWVFTSHWQLVRGALGLHQPLAISSRCLGPSPAIGN